MSIEGNGITPIGTFDTSPLEASFEIDRTDTETDQAVDEVEVSDEETIEDDSSDEGVEYSLGLEDQDSDSSEYEDGSDEEDYSNYSDAQILALSYMEDGTLPDDIDVSDLDASTLKEKLLESLQNIADARAEDRLRERVPTDQHYEYAEMLFNGATDEQTVYARTLDQLSTLDISLEDEQGEQLRKHVIEQHYIAKGFSKEKAEKFTNTHFEDGEDLDEAKLAQEYFANESKALKKELKDAAEAERKKKAERDESFRNDVKSKIEQGEFGGIKLTAKEKKKMLPALFESTEVIETPDGKSHKVSLYQKKMHEIQNDVDKQLLLAKIVLFDELSAEKIKSRAKTESNKDLLKFLDGNNTKRPSTKGKAKQTINRNIQPIRTIKMGLNTN